jgi:uncharacterized protein (TIGR00725 family)
MRVTVFGGASPKPGEPAYDQAQRLGKLLGEAGHTVLTGGYMGTMEAVSCGAAEAGAHVIGVTCDEVENWRQVACNRWVSQELRFPTLRQRLFALIENCDAALALPGGPGTLAEVSLMWNHLLIEAIPPRPLILIGPGWKSTIDAFFSALGDYTPARHRRWLSFAETVDAAVPMLEDHHENVKGDR